ncbi:MAG: 4Fe-4S binding protein [Thermodesulfobacteriota bacterium]
MEPTSSMKQNRRRQHLLGIVLILLVAGGWLLPPLGYFMVFCMVMAMGIGAVKGRSWCDWMCPRGSFWDGFMGRISRKARVPGFFRSTPFRLLWLGLLMTMLAVNLRPVWGDYYRMGKPFVMILTVTTAVGLVLGVLFHPRIWCMFCPMGTMANWLGRRRKPLLVDEGCIGCGLCEKVCRMQIYPGAYRETGAVTHGDCLKCSYCVERCPQKALRFQTARKEEEAC